jgi:hypothetical protein
MRPTSLAQLNAISSSGELGRAFSFTASQHLVRRAGIPRESDVSARRLSSEVPLVARHNVEYTRPFEDRTSISKLAALSARVAVLQGVRLCAEPACASSQPPRGRHV